MADLYKKAVHDMMDSVLSYDKIPSSVDIKRTTQLRVSSFPFCGLEWFMRLPIGLSSSKKVDFLFSYYTEVGTTVHRVIQRVLELDARKFRIYGDWTCKDCNHKTALSLIPQKCSGCGGNNFNFDEVSLSHEVLPDHPRVNGHIDTLFAVGKKVVLVTVDYKTSTLNAVSSKTTLPYLENACQIKGYVGILHDKGLDVSDEAMLVYIPRDNPHKYKVVSVRVSFKKQKKILEGYVRDFKSYSEVKTWEDLKVLVQQRKCVNSLHKDHVNCPWAKTCAGDTNTKAMLKEVKRVFHIVESKLPVTQYENSSRRR